jgi:antitoxin component of MazEF toxin-antitoxin module
MIIRKIQKIGDQLFIQIPKIIANGFEWKKGDYVAIVINKKRHLEIFKVVFPEKQQDKSKNSQPQT